MTRRDKTRDRDNKAHTHTHDTHLPPPSLPENRDEIRKMWKF